MSFPSILLGIYSQRLNEIALMLLELNGQDADLVMIGDISINTVLKFMFRICQNPLALSFQASAQVLQNFVS